MQPQNTPAIYGLSLDLICTLTDEGLRLTLPVNQFYIMSQHHNLLSVRHVTGDGNSAPFCYQILLSCLTTHGLIASVSPLTDISFVFRHTCISSCVRLLHRTTVLYVLLQTATVLYVLLQTATVLYVLLPTATVMYVLLQTATLLYVLLETATLLYVLLQTAPLLYVLLQTATLLLQTATLLLQTATLLYVLFRDILFPSLCCTSKGPFGLSGCCQ
jgi:hypothetical protein